MRKNRSLWKKIISFALCATMLAGCLMLSGCNDEGQSPDLNNTGRTDIILGDSTDIKTFDPQQAYDVYSHFMLRHLYNRLVKVAPSGDISCELADSYEIIDDTTYHFVLKQGIKFHDGSELKAEDVKFTIERAQNIPNTASEASNIKSVTVNGDYDFTIESVTAYPPLLAFLGSERMSIVSKAAVTEAEKNGGEYGENPVGTGPFKYAEWVPNDYWKLVRFDDYFAGPEAATSLTCRIIPEDSARLIALETGEIDVALQIGAADANYAADNEDISILRDVSAIVWYIGFNMDKDVFKDAKVREAISHAINRQEYVDIVLDGAGEFANSYVGKTVPSWDESVQPYAYDVELAKSLLADAGYPNGLDLNVYVKGETNNRNAQILQAQLKKININLEIVLCEGGALLDGLYAGNDDLYILSWENNTGDDDFSYTPPFHSSGIGSMNFSCINDSVLDRMIEDAGTCMDNTARLQKYQDIQKYLMDMAPWIPLYYPQTIIGIRSDLQGFSFNATLGNYAGGCYYTN